MAAIIVAIVSQAPRNLEEVRHVQILSAEDDGEYTFRFEPEVERVSTDHVLRLLPIGGQLWFFDSNKTISDPGLYVSMRRITEDEFALHYGNHGWTSDWFAISSDVAHDYFWICHDDNLVDQGGWPHTDMRFQVGMKVPREINRDKDYHFLDYVRTLIAGEVTAK